LYEKLDGRYGDDAIAHEWRRGRGIDEREDDHGMHEEKIDGW
jgi:hypothetical protein